MAKSVLLIVEGERAEKRLMEALFDMFFPQTSAKVYSYCTTLHELAGSLFVDGMMDEDLDILQVLRESVSGPEDRRLLYARYTDIYLVFDMDPHYQKSDLDRLAKMICFFQDSTDEGRLYINYPMVESYRHMPVLDGSFFQLQVENKDIPRYKELVNREGSVLLRNMSKIDRRTFLRVIALHLRKYRLLTENSDGIPGVGEYLQLSFQKLLEEQVSAYGKGYVHVLNTSPFSVVDHNPTVMLSLLSDPDLSS